MLMKIRVIWKTFLNKLFNKAVEVDVRASLPILYEEIVTEHKEAIRSAARLEVNMKELQDKVDASKETLAAAQTLVSQLLEEDKRTEAITAAQNAAHQEKMLEMQQSSLKDMEQLYEEAKASLVERSFKLNQMKLEMEFIKAKDENNKLRASYSPLAYNNEASELLATLAKSVDVESAALDLEEELASSESKPLTGEELLAKYEQPKAKPSLTKYEYTIK